MPLLNLDGELMLSTNSRRRGNAPTRAHRVENLEVGRNAERVFQLPNLLLLLLIFPTSQNIYKCPCWNSNGFNFR